MLVLDAMGDHMVEAYSNMGLVMALYVESIVSLCLSHLVDQRTLSMGSVLDALDTVLSICLFYVSLESRVRPSNFGCVFMSSVLLLICRFSLVLYSAGLTGCRCVFLCLSFCVL